MIKINFKVSEPTRLSYDYKNSVTKFIFNALKSKKHKYHGLNQSCFTVSNIIGGVGYKDNILFLDGGHFYINSHKDEFIIDFVKGISTMSDEELFIVDGIKIDSMEKVNPIDFNNCTTFRTLSPIIIKIKNKFYTHLDKGFDDMLVENINHALALNGFDKDDTLKIKTLSNAKKRLAKYDDIINVGTMATFKVEGKPQTLEFMYKHGVGVSRAIGFGCVMFR